MSYTKGPWSFDGHGINMAGGCRFATLSQTPQKYENEDWEPMPRKEVDANARLVAAAPELLKSLRELHLILFDYGHYSPVEKYEALERSKYALQKASNNFPFGKDPKAKEATL